MANEITPLEIRSGVSEVFRVTRHYCLEVWCSSPPVTEGERLGCAAAAIV